MRTLAGTGTLLLAATLLGLIFGEIVVRQLGHTDMNGQFRLHGYWVRPRELPVASFRRALEAYDTSRDSALEYDPTLGWKPRANEESRDGLYRYNSRGMRADRDYSSRADSGVVRVLLFGDSFVHGDEVALDDTFGERVPGDCASLGCGRRVEVLNLGVPGYGLDQAFLHFQQRAAELHPDIVVLGFQAENVMRITNVVRCFYNPLTQLPFSKPRFVLSAGGLSLINRPCLPPDQLLEVVRNPAAWELHRFEDCYRAEDYADVWWRRSRFASFTAEVLEAKLAPRRRPFQIDSEAGQITLLLLDRFAEQSEELSAEFVVLHLPIYYYFDRWQRRGRFDYQALLDTIASRHRLVATEEPLSEAAQGDSGALFEKYHYSALAHSVVAEELAQTIVELVAPR